jgi:tight adherence protein B
MLPVLIAACVSILALGLIVILMIGGGKSKRVNLRLAALDQDFAPPVFEEQTADIRKEQKRLSAIPWLNAWLIRMDFSAKASLFLYQAGMNATLGTLILGSVACAVIPGYLFSLRTGNPLFGTGLAVVLMAMPWLFVRRKRTKRLGLLEQQLPEALNMMASALRVGHSFVASLGAVAQESPEPVGGEMRRCFEEQNYGIDLRTTLNNLTTRVPIQDFRIFVAAVLVQKESGGNLAEVLDKVVETARERFRLKKQVSVHTAQGRMTGWMLSLLPAVIGSALYVMNPDGMSVLWKTSIGQTMLYGAIAMDVIGTAIIRKIVNIRV